MAKKGFPILERVAAYEFGGEALDTLIPRLVNERGLLNTAKRFRVAPNTVRNWLSNNGYGLRKRVEVVRRDR